VCESRARDIVEATAMTKERNTAIRGFGPERLSLLSGRARRGDLPRDSCGLLLLLLA